VHHVGILYGQFMMHGQRNIKSRVVFVLTVCLLRMEKQTIGFKRVRQ